MMEGISHEVCSVCRHAEARQAHRGLRRQRHFHRRQGRGLVRRRHGRALRGLRLARAQPQVDGQTATPSRRRWRRPVRSPDKAVADLCPTIIGLGRRTSRARRPCTARPWAPRRLPRRARFGVDRAAVRNTGRHSRGLGSCARRARARAGVAHALRGLQARNFRPWRRNSSGAWRAICRTASPIWRMAYIGQAGRGQGAGDAPILAGDLNALGPALPELFGRLGGSHALERHAAQGFGQR
jgi:hypothetical protein